VTLRLLHDAVDAEDVVQDLVEDHQWHVELLFVEDLK
jgi:hypothetical protein